MQRHEGDFSRGLGQRIQIMIMQRNAPCLDTLPHRMAGEQFPRRTQQHGAITFWHAIQPAEDHHRSGTRPGKPRRHWAKMARIERKGTFRRGINRFQSPAWWQPLRCRQKLWRRGGCAP